LNGLVHEQAQHAGLAMDADATILIAVDLRLVAARFDRIDQPTIHRSKAGGE